MNQLILQKSVFFSVYYGMSGISFESLAGLHLSKVEKTIFDGKKMGRNWKREKIPNTRRNATLDSLLPYGTFRISQEETRSSGCFCSLRTKRDSDSSCGWWRNTLLSGSECCRTRQLTGQENQMIHGCKCAFAKATSLGSRQQREMVASRGGRVRK